MLMVLTVAMAMVMMMLVMLFSLRIFANSFQMSSCPSDLKKREK